MFVKSLAELCHIQGRPCCVAVSHCFYTGAGVTHSLYCFGPGVWEELAGCMKLITGPGVREELLAAVREELLAALGLELGRNCWLH